MIDNRISMGLKVERIDMKHAEHYSGLSSYRRKSNLVHLVVSRSIEKMINLAEINT